MRFLHTNYFKRSMAGLLALIMIFSMLANLPHAHAEEVPAAAEPVWASGTIDSVTGQSKVNQTRLRTEGYYRLTDYAGVGIGLGYTMTNFVYDAEYNYLGTSSWLGSGRGFTTEELQNQYPSGVYFRVALRSVDSITLTVDDLSATGVKLYAPGEEIPQTESTLKYTDVGNIGSWQDGAIYNGRLFVLGGSGTGAVYDLDTLTKLGTLTLDNKDILNPHANSVCFGSTYYAPEDMYPLLYVNIYNNYADAQDRMEGTCCVYRLTEKGGVFSTELVQVIQIGFTEDLNLWKSKENNGDVRPYGNFAVDTDNNKLYAFVMRDADKTTRFFRFDLPALSEGTYSEIYGCNVVTLESTDIEAKFDTVYFNYLQGCCYHAGKIFSVEGFGGDASALRVVDPAGQRIEYSVRLSEANLTKEPEVLCVDADTDTLYYAAADGILRKMNVPVDMKESLEGKTISILGASISTYAGTSNGAAADTANSTIRNNAKYYPHSVVTDVKLNDTWWMQVCEDLGLRLLVNNAWSGSSLLHERSGTVGAYVDRCVRLHDDTGSNAGEAPDIIAIQMGTNDFQYYKDTLGTADIDYDSLILSNGDGTYTYAEPSTSLEAAAIVLHKITVRYPGAEVYYLNISQRVDGTDELIRSFNAELKQVVEHFGAHIVDIYGSAITMEDFDTYIGDGRAHPNKLGMDAYAEAFKRALIANTSYRVDTHTVTLDLDGVAANYGDDKIVVSGNSFTVDLAASDELKVTVTMGGKDITDAAYANGTVTISSVTDDVIITAESVYIPNNYRWEFSGTDLVCVSGENTLTKNAGTTTDGVFTNTRYALDRGVVLLHDRPWAVEWKCEGTWKNSGSSTGARLFSTTDVNAQYNARYIFKSNTNGIIAMGEKTTTGSHNYGLALADYGIDWTALHTYRLENRIAADGSNMIWLYVDGEEIGPMTHYYVGTTDQKTTSDWLSGKDFVFPYMGTDTHGFTNASIDYVAVWEATHIHSYQSTVTAPTCTERGCTAYTCTCGESYTDSYVEALGHSWDEGVCTACGAEKKPYQRLTYFTVDVTADNGKVYTDNAVLYLPASYTPDGEPVKLVIYCKQGSSQITSSANPIEAVGFYNYLISLGYAVLGVDGVPDAWRDELGLDNTRVVGNPLAVRGTQKAYNYVVDNYNIASDGCFISGYSQGGHYAQNVIDLTDIPILAAAEQSPVCSMRYHQWDLNASQTVGGVKFTKAARLNVARIYGFPAFSTNTELLNLAYDASLVAEYDPWVRNAENVYTGFVQKSNLWYLPAGTALEDISMKKTVKCPVKIWCAQDDTAISADVMKVFVQAIQNAGGTAEISIAPSGGHGFFQKQTPVGTFTENGKTYKTLPIAVEIAQWFQQYGGYECKHNYSGTTCTICGEEAKNYSGKVISILSASTSTFAGYIPVADGFNLQHRPRYPQDNLLTDVNETWWMQVINDLDAKLGVNDSWAGSTVSNFQDTNSGDLGPDAAMASLTRIQNLGANGTPDLILFYGGGNDMGRGVTLGSFHPATAPKEVNLTATKWDSFADAYVAAIMRLQYFYPDTQIVVILSHEMPSYVTAAKLDKYGSVIKAICDHYGVKYVELRDCGITFDMLPDNIHPNAEGMDCITADVLDTLLNRVDMMAGESVVYSVTHSLTNARASKSYYKGISSGKKFEEVLAGEDLTVTVTMGGQDITASVYANGKISIPEVTGAVEITVKGSFDADGHLQQLPENLCAGINLWKTLEPENIYYTATGWGNTTVGTSWSITFPVKEGDRIWATSLGAYPDNGSDANGVRVTWFDENGVLATLDRGKVYAEFAKYGYITAPEGAVALNLPMTNNQAHYAVYILTAEHTYGAWYETKAPTCEADGEERRDCVSCDAFETRSVACTHKLQFDWDVDGDGVLEILAIGNSFSVDVLEYTYQIAWDLGIEQIVIGNLYIGGCTLKTHAANAAGDLAKYTYYYNDNGTWTSKSSYKISTALTSRSWDYISLQQQSGNSGIESTYDEDLTNLIAYVKDLTSSASNVNRNPCAKLVWHMTWAYQQNSTHSAFADYGKDQMTMYNAIVSAVQNKICTNADIDIVVPSGTAVQNARTSLVGDTLTRDGYHMSYDYGRYLTGLMFIKTLTGLDVSGIQYTPSGVSELYRQIAAESVNNAHAKPFAVTQSAYTGEVPEEGYIELKPQLYKGAFWYPIQEGRYNELIYDMSNSHQFYATIRFTRETLPEGSIIILENGWQYRPDGWVTDTLQTGTRESATTQPYVVVTEQWWKDYTIRGFNISKVGLPSLKNTTEEEVRAAFRIFVPEDLHIHTPAGPVRENETAGGYEEVVYCETCGCELSREAVATHVPGDITGDGEVNNKDLTRLFRYLTAYDVQVNEAALDVNGDGSVNNKDQTRLFRYLSGYDVEIY